MPHLTHTPREGWEASSRFPSAGNDGRLHDEPNDGWVRAPFGIFGGRWVLPDPLGSIETYSLTHLKSGMRVALFDAAESAAECGDLAACMDDWSLADRGSGRSLAKRMRDIYRAWKAAGYVPIGLPDGKVIWAKNHAETPTQGPAG